VGERSSGKSLVLQAITQLPFYISDEMCNRFPTEVALHHSSEPTSVKFSIRSTLKNASNTTHFKKMEAWSPSILNDVDLDSADFEQKFADYQQEVWSYYG